MLLKFVEELPSETLLTQSPKRTGSMTGFSIYQAIGFESVFDKGREMSIGFDKSTSKVWFWWWIVASIVLIFCRKGTKARRLLYFMIPNLTKTNQMQFHRSKTFLFWLVSEYYFQ